MKKSILLVCVLFAGLSSMSFANGYHEGYFDLNSAYNKVEPNPSNYQRDEGYGLSRLN